MTVRATAYRTRDLATGPVALRLGSRRRWLGPLLGGLLLLAALAGGFGMRAMAARVELASGTTASEAAFERLRRDRERLATELAMERSTRRALHEEMAGLNAELDELRREREFLQSQGARARRTAP